MSDVLDITEQLQKMADLSTDVDVINTGLKAIDEIERLRAENERLQRYEKLVHYIANDYWELSHDKIKWLYTEYKNKCRKLIEEDNT